MNRLVLIFFLGIIIFHPCYNIKKNIKIILFLIGLICILQKSEGFGNIDAEALQNMASLYNSSTGVLKVNNLEASGYIKAGDYGEFGNAYIGPYKKTTGSNWIAVQHKDLPQDGNNYALSQKNDGTLNLNAKKDKYVNILTNDDETKAVTIKDGDIKGKTIIATDYGEFGSAYIGKYKYNNKLDSRWATFCHKDITDMGNNYALIQNSVGRTVLNSASAQPVDIKKGDSTLIFSSTGHDINTPRFFPHIYFKKGLRAEGRGAEGGGLHGDGGLD